MVEESAGGGTPEQPLYRMRISRMTVDKLGVRLYDTVSAVVAELIANGYDADASTVTVRLPLATSLAQLDPNSHDWVDIGHFIEVVDDGHGMTRGEANEHFLRVGRERRAHPDQGPNSRVRGRAVMGRKGIGKLAPFGICRRMEVVSAGGPETINGYCVSHFILDYDRILQDDDKPVALDAGDQDGTYRTTSGTTIRLSHFIGKRVPALETFLRQLARRFTPTEGFEIVVEDTRAEDIRKGSPERNIVGPLDVPIQQATKIDLSARPVRTENGEDLPVTGWLALAKDAYKDEETTGVRIYARNKIAGWTRDFEQPAGYTGEFTMRSYLVGEIHAEWLDLDDGEDLVKTDRQAIIWDSEYGNALRTWGANLIKEMGTASRNPRRTRVKQLFFNVSRIDERIRSEYSDSAVVDAALDLANKIGGFAAEDELTDEVYVKDLSDIILTVAPHSALMKAFQEFEKLAEAGPIDIDKVQTLFRKSRIAELASYGQIALERVRAIESLEAIVREHAAEDAFQQLIAAAPWLVEPTWSIISENESLTTFIANFAIWYRDQYGEEIVLAISYQKKRPDFVLVDVGHKLHVVEVKPSGHTVGDDDAERLLNYAQAFSRFFEQHEAMRIAFPNSFQITLVADAQSIRKANNNLAFELLVNSGRLRRFAWTEFLARARGSHEQFLRASRLFREANAAIEAEEAAAKGAVQVAATGDHNAL